jgi:hypothetical protein
MPACPQDVISTALRSQRSEASAPKLALPPSALRAPSRRDADRQADDEPEREHAYAEPEADGERVLAQLQSPIEELTSASLELLDGLLDAVAEPRDVALLAIGF